MYLLKIVGRGYDASCARSVTSLVNRHQSIELVWRTQTFEAPIAVFHNVEVVRLRVVLCKYILTDGLTGPTTGRLTDPQTDG